MRSIETSLAIRRAVAEHPIISKYFKVLGADSMVPAEFRPSGFKDFLTPGTTWVTVLKAMQEDEFFLDPTRMTLVCGSAGMDGNTFKGLLSSKYNIQVNKTSRNSVLVQSNINNTRSDVALLIKVLLEMSQQIDADLAEGGEGARAAFAKRVKNLMEDVPDLPNFSRFHDGYRENPESITLEGDMRTAFFAAYEEDDCEYLALMRSEDRRAVKERPGIGVGQLRDSVSAGLPDHGARPGDRGGHDRLHAQARRQGNPWLQPRARAQADQAVGDSAIKRKDARRRVAQPSSPIRSAKPHQRRNRKAKSVTKQ